MNATRILWGQIFLVTLVVLIFAGLMIRSFYKLQQVNPGFSHDRLTSFSISLPQKKYANDEARLNNFILTLLTLQGRHLSADEVASLQSAFRGSGFSSTETRLNSFGIERTTRSAFGQFGTFVSLLQPDSSGR